MPIPYLNAGDEPLAEYWDLLWAELDRKIAVAMDDHALPYASFHVNPNLQRFHWPFGRTFCFVGTNRPYTNAFGNQYVHQPFLDAVSATAADKATTTFPNANYEDKLRKVVRLKPFATSYYTAAGLTDASQALLDSSLEAHRKVYTATGTTIPEAYWVMDNRAIMPEKVYNSALAEIMVEDYGASLTIPANYNKYNFFRINNCQNIVLTVTFQANTGPGHTVSIPKYQSKCVRRDGVDGTYTDGYKYFQRVLPGDYRHAYFGNTGSPIYNSSLVNNAVNPFNTFQAFVALFDGSAYGPNAVGLELFNRVDGPVLIRDFHSIPDALPAISGAGQYFPESIADGTLIGDLLYHRGIIKSIQGRNPDATLKVVDVHFTGFNSTDWAGNGLFLGTDADGSPTIARTHGWDISSPHYSDLLIHSSNVLLDYPPISNFLSKPVVDITSTPFKVWSRAPGVVVDDDGDYAFYPYFWEQVIPFDSVPISSIHAEFYNYPDTGSTAANFTNYISRQGSRSFDALNMRVHQSTVGDLKNLNIVGLPSLSFTNQETSVCTYDSKEAKMSWGGLTLKYRAKCKQVFPIGASSDLTLGINSGLFLDRAFVNFDSGFMTVNGRVQFYGYGWATIRASALDPRTGLTIGGPGNAPAFQGYCYSPRGAVPYEKMVLTSAAIDKNNISLDSTSKIWKHPFSIDEPYGPGTEVSFSNLGDYTDIGLRLLTPFGTTPTSGGRMAVQPMLNQDVAFGAYQILPLPPNNWESSRTRMAANGPLATSDGIDVPSGNQMSYARRLLLTIESYNCMATVVNQFWIAKPLNFDRAKLTVGSGYTPMFPPNKRGIFFSANSSIRPAEQYASFGLNDATYLTCQALGIPIRTKADFPASWNIVKGTNRQNWYSHTVAAGVGAITLSPDGIRDLHDGFGNPVPIMINEAFGVTVAEPSEFYWCKIADVRALAVANGFQFIFEDETLGFKLEVATGGGFAFIANNYSAGGTPDSTPRDSGIWTNRAVLLEVDNSADVEFVGEHRPIWSAANGQSSVVVSNFSLQDIKEPDLETGFVGDVDFATGNPSTNIITFSYDMDTQARSYHVGGNFNYNAAYRIVGDYAAHSLVMRNFSTTPRNGMAVAFPKASAIAQADNFSSDNAHVVYKSSKGLVGGLFSAIRQESAFPLDITQAPNPVAFDPSGYSLSIPINRGTDVQVVKFGSFGIPGARQCSVYQFSDNYIRL